MIVLRFHREILASPVLFEPFLLSEAKKTSLDSINECVLKVFFKKKYLIVKGRTAVGALKTFFTALTDYPGDKWEKVPDDNLNIHFIKYFWEQSRGFTFRIKVLIATPNALELLKREQIELWKAKNDQNCLNNTIDAYIPLYREETDSYGWIGKGSVLNFLKWKNKNLPQPMLENCETSGHIGN